ncbi:MAG: hypothetical protein HY046_00705 [Acidobacteria bacterium]|nr:hypothetical protein [Acidobacteriota bacterium]
MLHALQSFLAKSGAHPASIQVFVRGQLVTTVSLPGGTGMASPILADLSAWIGPGQNDVKLVRTGGARLATAQIVSTYYAPWAEADPAKANAVRIGVNFDRTSLRSGETVECRVHIERAPQSHGMYVAEVGLPPGSEVDRASLDRVVLNSMNAVNSYDVLPDRVIFYVWPNYGQTELSFTFRSRYALRAKSAPSILYDYYNPEARATAGPVLFSVQEK